MRISTVVTPIKGTATAARSSPLRATLSTAPDARAAASVLPWRMIDSTAAATNPGMDATSSTTHPTSKGTLRSTQTVTTAWVPRRQRADPLGASPSHQAGQHGPDPREQVGDTGQVADDVVAVEAKKGDELLQDRQVLNHDGGHQHLEASELIHGGQDQDAEPVEIDTTEVGS